MDLEGNAGGKGDGVGHRRWASGAGYTNKKHRRWLWMVIGKYVFFQPVDVEIDPNKFTLLFTLAYYINYYIGNSKFYFFHLLLPFLFPCPFYACANG